MGNRFEFRMTLRQEEHVFFKEKVKKEEKNGELGLNH